MLLHKSYYLCFTIIICIQQCSFLHTNNVLHLYRYHFIVTSVHSLQLHVCIANVHMNSLDNIYCTFEKLFCIHYLYRYQQFQQEWPIYRKINSNFDHQILQTDLTELEKWSDKWQMQFNLSKCVHLPITNKTKPSSHQYSLFGHPLSKVASHSYLGVKLDSKLSWARHITEITSKLS